ncbi:MAG: NUDIX hydrolase [Dethiobacter sp.]|nr:NUDIX hydrolase [Dethiobacter sp.]
MEKTLASKIIYQGKIISVRLDDVLLDNGKQARREVVEHPGAAAVLAVTDQGEAYFVRQYRQAVGEELLEIPAGKLDPGEEPVACAIRELAEEAGVKPGKISPLAEYFSSPGFASERLYLYLATELEPTAVQQPEDEILHVCLLPLRDAVKMARQGKIGDGKTLLALLLAADILKL